MNEGTINWNGTGYQEEAYGAQLEVYLDKNTNAFGITIERWGWIVINRGHRWTGWSATKDEAMVQAGNALLELLMVTR